MNHTELEECALILAQLSSAPIRRYILSLDDDDTITLYGTEPIRAGDIKPLIRKAKRNHKKGVAVAPTTPQHKE